MSAVKPEVGVAELLCELAAESPFAFTALIYTEYDVPFVKPEIVKEYLTIPNRSYFKFVIANEQDALDAQIAVSKYKDAGIDIPVYLMPVGGVNSVYDLNERQVADYARDIGYRFSPRIQVPLYKNEWGT